MIKKKFGLVATSVMIVGLVACNNNEGALDGEYRDNVDVAENVNYNGRSYGPLARDIDTRNPDNNMNDDDFSNVPDRMLTKDPNGMTISSSNTDLSSKDYPHTRAIAVQDAKYKFIKANSKEEAEKQARQFIDQQKQQALQYGNQIAKQYQSQQQQSANRQQAPADRQQAQNNQQQQNQAPAEQQEQATDQQQKQEPAQPAQPQQQQPAAEAPKKDEPQAQGVSQVAQQVIDLTNAERKKNGLPALKADTQLSGVAQKKSEDMQQNNYFSHTSPTYGSPFDMMRDFGVTYKTAGENIAQGQRSAQEVVQAWMNSEGHRKNILSKDFTHIGIGYDSNGHHWTQMFIGK
ncbi:CAP domain-containing protein [Metabacillus halosaccharovorans]|uniref:CAP domain-containing protein n=1 Tax=Metabacillus halosaccharovorans TaxID=930124 RepID=UPI00203B9706|nr:CAP domain-containing protein [Metabacillus halosaccharovorans]MCM3440918.1 CAP domain-containing protein [Metabacillus halosaccharovorans]